MRTPAGREPGFVPHDSPSRARAGVIADECQVRKVSDHDVGPGATELVGVVMPVDADDGSESPATAGLDPRERIFDQQDSPRNGTQPLRGEQEARWIGLAGQGVVGRIDTVHDHVEQSADAAGVEHLATVPTGRYHRHAPTTCAELLHEVDGAREDANPFAPQPLVEQLILAVAESVHGGRSRQVVRVAPRQVDPPRCEKRRDPVGSGLAVHISQIVGLAVERRGIRHRDGKEAVEKLCPRRRVHTGRVGDDTVQIEYCGVELAEPNLVGAHVWSLEPAGMGS